MLSWCTDYRPKSPEVASSAETLRTWAASSRNDTGVACTTCNAFLDRLLGARTRLPDCPFARLPVCPFARLPVCPFARLPVCPFAREETTCARREV
jgi:hypothetical protein